MKDEVIRTDNGSIIQHGKYNDRIYLMKIDEKDIPAIIVEINDLAHKNSYGKILARVPLWALPLFKADGYITEAYIPGYIKGEEDIHFVSKFLNSDRLRGIETDMLRKLSNILLESSGEPGPGKTPEYDVNIITEGDTAEVADLFRQVFKTYPFPVHDPEYIINSMKTDTRYFGIKNNKNEFIAVSSAEIDPDNLNAEMTDFAVLKSHRGKKTFYSIIEGNGNANDQDEHQNLIYHCKT